VFPVEKFSTLYVENVVFGASLHANMDSGLHRLSVRSAVPSLQLIAAQGVQCLAKQLKNAQLPYLFNGVPLFMHLLDSNNSNSSDQRGLVACAETALGILSADADTRSQLLAAGCVPQLLQVLSKHSCSISTATSAAATAAAEFLAFMAQHADSRAAIAQTDRAFTLFGMIQVVMGHADHLLGRRRCRHSSDSEVSESSSLDYDDAAIAVLLKLTGALVKLLERPDTNSAATEALLHHEQGVSTLLELCRCRYLWSDEDLGYRVQQALLALPALQCSSRGRFLQA
jgi:hypothetical protein